MCPNKQTLSIQNKFELEKILLLVINVNLNDLYLL
jgi:hypothetical protein